MAGQISAAQAAPISWRCDMSVSLGLAGGSSKSLSSRPPLFRAATCWLCLLLPAGAWVFSASSWTGDRESPSCQLYCHFSVCGPNCCCSSSHKHARHFRHTNITGVCPKEIAIQEVNIRTKERETHCLDFPTLAHLPIIFS